MQLLSQNFNSALRQGFVLFGRLTDMSKILVALATLMLMGCEKRVENPIDDQSYRPIKELYAIIDSQPPAKWNRRDVYVPLDEPDVVSIAIRLGKVPIPANLREIRGISLHEPGKPPTVRVDMGGMCYYLKKMGDERWEIIRISPCSVYLDPPSSAENTK